MALQVLPDLRLFELVAGGELAGRERDVGEPRLLQAIEGREAGLGSRAAAAGRIQTGVSDRPSHFFGA